VIVDIFQYKTEALKAEGTELSGISFPPRYLNLGLIGNAVFISDESAVIEDIRNL